MGQAVWIEVEQMLWGVRNDLMDHFLEICFCCPCCCIAMRLARNATASERHRFHPAGWTAVPDRTKCVGCRKCAEGHNGCPVEAISFGEDGKVVIDQEKCVGCGICVESCPAEKKAVSFKDGKRIPEYDYKLCIRCFCCQEMCPKHAISAKVSPLARFIDRNWKI